MNEYTPGSVWVDADGDLWAVVDNGGFVLIVSADAPTMPGQQSMPIDDWAFVEPYGPLVKVFDGEYL